MPDRRAIESALKSMYQQDGESALEAPLPRKKRAKRYPPPAASQSGVPNGRDFAGRARRHDRKCSVCRHPERAEIENEFLCWRSPETIAKEYGIAHHSAIYRHAHATGLFAQRATHLKLSLGPLIEQAMIVPVTADSIVRAIALCARLNEQGELINPPKEVIYRTPHPGPTSPRDFNIAPAKAGSPAHSGTRVRNSNRESVSTSA